jgi:MOSC domain-containing protein YiiM
VTPAARCPVCSFDPTQLDLQDAVGTLRSFELRWRWTVERLDASTLHPLERALTDAASVAVDGVLSEDVVGAVHRGTHALTEAGRWLAPQRPGAGARGSVVGLFTSGGGVPKLPIDQALVGFRGVAGDRQAARQHHGRFWQALCLWSSDVVDALAAEGHPIAIGSCGENVSITGIDWTTVRPGVRLAIGDEVVVEVSSFSPPCRKNARWFVSRQFSRIDHDTHPGWSRVYATVRSDGVIRRGDTVIVEPTTTP